MLTSSTIISTETNMTRKKRQSKTIGKAKIFSSLSCEDKIRAAIHFTCEGHTGSVLTLGYTDKKNGDSTCSALINNHPNS